MPKNFRMTVPYIARVAEGKTATITMSQLLSSCQSQFAGAPWRLLSVAGEVMLVNTTRESGVGGALAQVRLHSAATSNVEAVVSKRFLVSVIPRKFSLRMPRPNPWKEDEDRGQALIGFDNCQLNDGIATVLQYYFEAVLEFGPMPFAPVSEVGVVEALVGNLSHSSSGSFSCLGTDEDPRREIDET